MIIPTSPHWMYFTFLMLLTAVVAAPTSRSLEETFEKVSPSPSSNLLQRRTPQMAMSPARTVGIVIALLAIMAAVVIAIVHILRGASPDGRAPSNHRPQTARRGHLTDLGGHDVSQEQIELHTFQTRAQSNLHGVPPADSVDTLPVYNTEKLPKYLSKDPEALQDEVTEPGAHPLPPATGDEEEIDLGTPQAIPQMESATPIDRPAAVRFNSRVLERL